MQMRAFYKVKTDRYLFNRNDGPEERIRQWVISELLSTYGININQIEVEVPIRVGTRTHYADIVVYKDLVPYIVIECKREETKSLKVALDQAISYADSSKLKASYVICTNGREWLVRKKVNQIWEIVPDVEIRKITNPTMDLSSFLFLIEDLKPIFYWLHREVPAKHSMNFFSNVHTLIYSSVFYGGLGLHDGFDHLVRVLANDPTLSKDYGMEKMAIAFESFMDYFLAMGISEHRARPEGYYNYELVNILLTSFERLTFASSGIANREIRWLRLITVHLQYLLDNVRKGEVLDVPATLITEYYAFFKPFCEDQLSVMLPENIEQEEIKTIRIICEPSDITDK